MGGYLTTITKAVETVLQDLGFKATDEIFDFDHTPNSAINKAYRIESTPLANECLTGNAMIASWSVEIYVAYKLKRDPHAAWEAAQDDREAIENAILMDPAILALGVVLPDQKATLQKYLEEYLVSKVALRFDYVRQLAATP